MKLKKARTCWSCRNLIQESGTATCRKSYPIESLNRDEHFGWLEFKPKVPCPKALTIREEIDGEEYKSKTLNDLEYNE